MGPNLSRLSNSRGLAPSICVFVLAASSGAAYADMTPTTGANVQVIVGATDATTSQDQQNASNVNAPSAASVSRNVAGSDGSVGGASASAFANFGTLGVSGTGGGSTRPAS